MTKTILIDAAHREETRVVVLENGILQDFDRDAIAIKQIKGNIYLAKVIRVEASLQAAFVDYGSDRHGFLPFSDIHPDYYQLPESEKQKLKDAEEKNSLDKNHEASDHDYQAPKRHNDQEEHHDNHNHDRDESSDSMVTGSYAVEDETGGYSGNIFSIHKRYNIQDVIKPGQMILVQVTKEERGNKGASMTTFISLAGKCCVLMANTPNKGGVSRKVDNFRDRKILKAILNEIAVPKDMSVIIRTAGVGKRPEDIKKDYEYLARLWSSIIEASSSSTSPTFIHAESDVIKRCLRDLYNDQVNEVVIEGNDAYESVVRFTKLTMPNSEHNIRAHAERIPIFNKYRVEQQISGLYEKSVQLPSGGSIVIDHSEALVAIDVNSGRATKETNVEEMAYHTNLEAVKEIARQLKLRDLAGLIVIDFIDMYDHRNRRNIERALRDALQNDRARIQLGRIGIFGLLEMSRQRLGASFFETITESCPHCNGTGYVRSVEILAVSILRAIRYACADKQVGVVYVYTSNEAISYMLNYKKNEVISTEKNYGVHIFMHVSDNVGGDGFQIKKRKGLNDEERRELEMDIETGKVNQSDIERDYFENYQDKHSGLNHEDQSGGRHDDFNRNRKKFKKHHRDRDFSRRKKFGKDNRNNNGGDNKSIIGSLMGKLLGKN